MEQEKTMKQEKHKVAVNIYGTNYTMRTMHTEEQVGRIVDYLNEKMEEVGQYQPKLNYKDIAVLAALNITEELLNVKEDYNQLLEIINEN